MAQQCIDYCLDDPMGEYEIISCPALNNGGIYGLVLLECGHGITDPSDATEVQAAIDAGKAHLIEGDGISLSFNDPSPVTRDSSSPCDSTPVLTTYDRAGDYLNDNVSSTNIDFHDQMFDGRRFGGLIGILCTEEDDPERVIFVNNTITFRGGYIVGAKKNDGRRFKGTLQYQSLKNPRETNAPPGIFNQ